MSLVTIIYLALSFQKLLWAVAEALKKINVSRKHKDFSAYGKKLYKICKDFWVNFSATRKIKSSVSDLMLSLASEHAENVVREMQQSQNAHIELISQDSNSCDFFGVDNNNNNNTIEE